MSTTFGRALRTALTLACALAALAVVAGPAAALPTFASTGAEADLIVLNGTPEGSNTYTVNAAGELSVTTDLGGAAYTQPAENGLPEMFARAIGLCSFPEYAGIYVSVGSLHAEAWQPTRRAGTETREAGPTVWANETAAVTQRRSGSCAEPTTIADQTLHSEEEFLVEVPLTFCREAGGDNALIGEAPGQGGTLVPYSVESDNDVWHIYSIGALGRASEELEEVVNLRITNLPDPSASC